MKKSLLSLVAIGLPLLMNAQAAFDALQLSNTELRGTSRSTAMAGAFGALGGDISAMNQNPAGIGVYRSSDIGFTMGLDFISTEVDGVSATDDATKFIFNNVGYVGVINLENEAMKYLNIGFSYNRNNSFHRHYRGSQGGLQTSISNYIAGVTNAGRWNSDDLTFGNSYNPYYDSSAPWLSVLSYDSYLINYNGDHFQGLYGDETTGSNEFEIDESGHADEYTMAIAGNVRDKVYWGASFGFTDLLLDSYQYYGESLNSAYIYNYNAGGGIERGRADYGYVNYLRTTGSGFNIKAGVIVKPMNELRLGFAVHTPTFYEMKDRFKTVSSFEMAGTGANVYKGEHETGDEGYFDENRYNVHTPWHFLASVAGVIGKSGIVSFDYECVTANSIRVCDTHDNAYIDVTDNVKDYFQAQHIFRIGAEYRLDNNWSVRAGFAHQTSPVKDVVKDNMIDITTVSTNTAYQYDKSVEYITAGLGYHYKSFYLDLAYVHKNRQSEYHAFSPVTGAREPGVYSGVKDNNNRVQMTMGFRF